MIPGSIFRFAHSQKSQIFQYFYIAIFITVFASFIQVSNSLHEVHDFDSDCVTCQLRHQLTSETSENNFTTKVNTEFLIHQILSKNFSPQETLSLFFSRAPPRHLTSVV